MVTDNNINNVCKSQIQYVFRQLIATAACSWLSVASGFAFGFSAVFLPQLKADPNFPYDASLSSWIASITPLSMVIGCLCAGTLIDRIGRKSGHIILALISTISWLVIAFATDNTLVLVGRFIAGLSAGSNRPVSLVYLGEIADPKYRSLTLICPTVSNSLGILISHLIGGYVPWRTSCFIYALSSISCLCIILFIKESPLWLITKGRIFEGVRAFRWFRGQSIEAERELKLVLERQNEKEQQFLLKNIIDSSFLKPLLTALLLAIAVQCNGVNIFSFYAQDLLQSTFKGDIDSFMLMVIIDNVRILTMALIFGVSKFVSRRFFFFFVSIGAALTIFGLVLFLLFMAISKFVWLSITIIGFYVAFGCSVVSLSWAFIPELFGGNLRGLGSGIVSSITYLLLFVIVKVSPGFTASYGEVALYSFFGITTVFITFLLYFLLPETSGRSLQDIEDSYKNTPSVVLSSL